MLRVFEYIDDQYKTEKGFSHFCKSNIIVTFKIIFNDELVGWLSFYGTKSKKDILRQTK